MKRIVFLTGAGMSAESGISTFRDSDGLWENYSVEEVCTHEAWLRQPEVCLNFYNMLRRKFKDCKPNEGHKLVAALQDMYDVQVITQNKCRPEGYDQGVYYPLDPENPDIKMGDVDSHGVQLRPHIVFFGEDVPNLSRAADIMETADIVVVIGTSLNVYPAASLLRYAPAKAPIWLIDPKPVHSPYREVTQIQKGASEGMKELDKILRG